MIHRHGRSLVLASAFLLPLLGGCTAIRDHQGFILDETLVSAVQPGVDNKDSVQAALGRPSFTGEFDDNDWYYVSRMTKNMAFNAPRPESQTILHVRFDKSGNVVVRAEVPFEREVAVALLKPEGSAAGTSGTAASGALPDPQTVIIKRGDNRTVTW